MQRPTPETVNRPANGFTLLEIVMVIAIIAILASLAIPSQMGSVTQRRVIETLELMEPYKPKVAAYFAAHNGTFPTDNEAIGLPASEKSFATI